MSQLTIFKASAGSGKTFRLVLEYLKLLVDNPLNYRHILAVTFTNKATAEMKARVIRDLHQVGTGRNKQMIELLHNETGIAPALIESNAKSALALILHDYDRFAVSTIDSFFQKVLRSFARETGLYGTYEIELDQDAVLNEACDRLLLSVEEDMELRKWLLAMSEDQLGQGKNWQIRDKILELGSELQNEPFQRYLFSRSDTKTERAQLNELKKKLFQVTSLFENRLKEMAANALQLIAEAGLELTDFKGGKNSFVNYFSYWSAFRSDKLQPTATLLKAIDQPDAWYVKKSAKKNEIEACVQNGLNRKLKELVDFLDKERPKYLSAVEIQKYLYALGVLSVLADKVREVGREKNALLLSEGNLLLNGIIGNNDVPFIYEKTGNYYRYFMIDEFQDTSLTQWGNFKPLVINSLAENFPNLVVGDVKQSIYRWRNSDWQLLDHRLKEELTQFSVVETTLDSNWRSSEEVVLFNNRLFARSADWLQQKYNQLGDNSPALYHNTITSAYSDAQQLVASGRKQGLIRCHFVEDESTPEYQQTTCKRLIETIKEVQDKGYRAGDIAILVKRNKEGKAIAEALLKAKRNEPSYNFELVSDDTLYIGSSSLVSFLCGLMNYLISPYDQVIQASIIHEYSVGILPLLKREGRVPGRLVTGEQQQLSFDEKKESRFRFISDEVRDDYFPFFNNEAYRNITRYWAGLSLIDLVELLIKQYHLDYLPGEQANIQAFRDVISDFSRKESGNLHKFIEWWEQHGDKVKLQTAGERDAIRIMTIHKSKGLEFPIVMVPFCDWSFVTDGRQSNILWCSTHTTPFNLLPLLPVKYSNKLRDSYFSEDYYTETLLSYIDNLNVLYVALTRAVDGLFLYTKAKEPKKAVDVGALLSQLVKDEALLEKCSENVYERGTLASPEHCAAKGTIAPLSGKVVRKTQLADTLRLRKNYEGFIDNREELRRQGISKGKLMHELLSRIAVADDVKKAVETMMLGGLIEGGEKEKLLSDVKALLGHQQAVHWFDRSWKVLNETTLITPDFGLLRPDRVMMGNGKVVVVDYKTSDQLRPAHIKQVRGYVNQIRKMGHEQVEGYVWYLVNNQIIDIEHFA